LSRLQAHPLCTACPPASRLGSTKLPRNRGLFLTKSVRCIVEKWHLCYTSYQYAAPCFLSPIEQLVNENLVLTFDFRRRDRPADLPSKNARKAPPALATHPTHKITTTSRVRCQRAFGAECLPQSRLVRPALPAKPISQIHGALTKKAQNNLARPTDIRTNLGLR